MSPKFVKDFFFPDHIKAQALDFAYHYVTEKGEKARMTSGMTLEATVFARYLHTLSSYQDKC